MRVGGILHLCKPILIFIWMLSKCLLRLFFEVKHLAHCEHSYCIPSWTPLFCLFKADMKLNDLEHFTHWYGFSFSPLILVRPVASLTYKHQLKVWWLFSSCGQLTTVLEGNSKSQILTFGWFLHTWTDERTLWKLDFRHDRRLRSSSTTRTDA